MKWGKEFGRYLFDGNTEFLEGYTESDIIYLDIFGSSVLIVNTSKAAFELMDRRSALYSSR